MLILCPRKSWRQAILWKTSYFEFGANQYNSNRPSNFTSAFTINTRLTMCRRNKASAIWRTYNCLNRSIPGKRPWALYHNFLFLAFLALTPGYWAMPCVKIEVGGAYCSTYASTWYMACTLVQAHVCISMLAKEHQWTSGSKVQEKRNSRYRTSIRLMGTCHIALGAACLGTYPGVGALHLTRQSCYLSAYPGVDAYPGYYGNWRSLHEYSSTIHDSLS